MKLTEKTKGDNKMELAEKILKKAEEKKHLAGMQSSAELCIADCKSWIRDGNEALAVYRGLKSLKYSLGIFSDVYKRLCEQAKEKGFQDYIPE